MKYLKYFQTETERYTYKNSSEFILPNVNYVVESDSVDFNPCVELPKAGDIAYWDGSKVKTVPYDKYDSSLGTAVGVIVVPGGFAPDGKARMVSLKFATSAGTSSSPKLLKWGPDGKNTILTEYTKVPTTDNVGSIITGSDTKGYLPSDNFSGTTSTIDPEAKYYSTSRTPYIVSPYLNGAANPDYYGEIEGSNNAALGDFNSNNALSDFNGSANTTTLVGLGSNYVAANAANNYSDGVSGTKWYLPAMGELGYLMPRFKEINNAIAAAGGVVLPSNNFWSSTEYSSDGAYYLMTYNGNVSNGNKTDTYSVRPFAIVE